MEGLTILYAEKYMAGHGFDLTAFLILSAVFTIFAFIAFIWAFVRECNTKKEGVAWGCLGATLTSIFLIALSALIAAISQPIYKDQYACTIDFNIIDQEEFQSKYIITETKGNIYIIREKSDESIP